MFHGCIQHVKMQNRSHGESFRNDREKRTNKVHPVKVTSLDPVEEQVAPVDRGSPLKFHFILFPLPSFIYKIQDTESCLPSDNIVSSYLLWMGNLPPPPPNPKSPQKNTQNARKMHQISHPPPDMPPKALSLELTLTERPNRPYCPS